MNIKLAMTRGIQNEMENLGHKESLFYYEENSKIFLSFWKNHKIVSFKCYGRFNISKHRKEKRK